MRYTLTKTFRFESAHRMSKGYQGKCANIHGHSWNGHVAFSFETLDEYDMGYDFRDMGAFTRGIEEQLDHKLLLCSDDTEIIALCRKQGLAIVIFEKNPTCETIARHFYDEIKEKLSDDPNIKIEYVQIEETCTTSCRYSG